MEIIRSMFDEIRCKLLQIHTFYIKALVVSRSFATSAAVYYFTFSRGRRFVDIVLLSHVKHYTVPRRRPILELTGEKNGLKSLSTTGYQYDKGRRTTRTERDQQKSSTRPRSCRKIETAEKSRRPKNDSINLPRGHPECSWQQRQPAPHRRVYETNRYKTCSTVWTSRRRDGRWTAVDRKESRDTISI